MLGAERRHRTNALNRQAGLRGPRCVVQAGVQHAGVVAALVAAESGLLVEERQLKLWRSLQQREGRAEADQAAANDDHSGL